MAVDSYNLVFEGKSLKEAMLEIRADALFWTREVYERVPRPGEKGTKGPLKGDKGDKGRQFARLPGKGPWKGKQPWPTYQPVFQPFLKENGKGKDTPGKKGDHKGKGKDSCPRELPFAVTTTSRSSVQATVAAPTTARD